MRKPSAHRCNTQRCNTDRWNTHLRIAATRIDATMRRCACRDAQKMPARKRHCGGRLTHRPARDERGRVVLHVVVEDRLQCRPVHGSLVCLFVCVVGCAWLRVRARHVMCAFVQCYVEGSGWHASLPGLASLPDAPFLPSLPLPLPPRSSPTKTPMGPDRRCACPHAAKAWESEGAPLRCAAAPRRGVRACSIGE